MNNDNSHNPYAPPTAKVEDVTEPKQAADLADLMTDPRNHRLGLRWLATAVDMVFLAVVYLLLKLSTIELGEAIFGPLCLAFLVLYYFVVEAKFGFTVGKHLCGIRVVDKAGSPPGYLRNLVRTLMRVIEVNPGLLGGVIAGIVCLVTQRSQRLGDIMTGTYVVPLGLLKQFHLNHQDGWMPSTKETL